MEADEILTLDLNRTERRLLRWGLIEWGGPALCTEEMAVALGFASVEDLFTETDRLIRVVESEQPMPALDWLRVLLATEVVFASNVIGSGRDWEATTGLSDEESLATLRVIQRKLAGIRRLVGRGFGTRPRRSGSA
jgi:hypothetical protein